MVETLMVENAIDDSAIEKKVGHRVIRLVRGDITDVEVEAFVFDITADLKLGSGYGGAITARGGKIVQDELDAIGTLATGEAILTTAGKMKATHIIHVNGPKYHESETEAKLAKCTEAALRLAKEHGMKRLAFPPIGTGLYQVPLALCARVMIETIAEHLAGETTLEVVDLFALDTREYEPLEARMTEGA